ncbi:PREDICTED: pancreatic lipase-related protein 2-like [Leptosomus discolor]|uniref:pancreatic lipase-related protein 2-like n=1 Tax=Leptosomus discolor TaxID=188344 RepID=UPI0005225B77|nr:PREDICTED: pancreatic lipase-related protein 2-like [Leptosomus discolor]
MRMAFDFLAKHSVFSGQTLMAVRSLGSGLQQPEAMDQSVESHSNWSDLVGVISDEVSCFWHWPTKSQMQLGTQASWNSGGMFVVWITTLLLLDAARGREVCYKRLGCFTDSPPWSGIPGRELAGLPSSPEDVNTNFLLYTRDNIMKYQKISATNPSTIRASNFRTHRKTRFIIHGHLAGADLPWITNICRSMFHTEDVNCILTDWRGGSSGLYTDAVNNVRVVGAELVCLVNLLEKDYGYSPANIHFIGHSLGAHAAGEAGRRKPGIGRITGLDPAGPLFQYTPTTVRLDPSDAKFVDIIHTHAGHLFFDFGILQTSGHLDFYPNGGKKMPGCKQLHVPPAARNINDLMREYRSIGCGHKRSLQYYAESIITPNGFVGYQCETYRAFVLDIFAKLIKSEWQGVTRSTVLIVINVEASTELENMKNCWRKEIHVRVSATETMKGNIDVALTGTNGIRKKYTIDKGAFKPGNTYLNYIDTEISGNISKVEFLWKKHQGHVCVLRLWNRAAEHVASPGALLRLGEEYRGYPRWQPSPSGKGSFFSQRQTINQAPSTDYEKIAQPATKPLFPN